MNVFIVFIGIHHGIAVFEAVYQCESHIDKGLRAGIPVDQQFIHQVFELIVLVLECFEGS